MEIEQVRAADLVVGDVIAAVDTSGWWSVTETRAEPFGMIKLTLKGVDAEDIREMRLEADRLVRRTDPASVHHKDEFLGMTAEQAAAWAVALGWAFNNRSLPGVVFSDDEHRSRINVWVGPDGTVARTKMG